MTWSGWTAIAKPEHAMDLDTGAVVAAEVHVADQGDTKTLAGTLASAAEHLAAVDAAPTPLCQTSCRLNRDWNL